MVIDTSALIAILLGEPEAKALAEAIAEDSRRLVSFFSLLETEIVIEAKKGEPGGRELDRLVHRTNMQVVPLDPDQVELAREAWKRFGKRRHKAGLNIGDCCSYALSKYTNQHLLFKGSDFSKTDITPVKYS